MTYSALKAMRQAKYTALHEKVGLFWAFSQQQFDEGRAKNPLDDGCKYVAIGMGGFFPGQNKQAYTDGMNEIYAWDKQATKEIKESRDETEKAILYELNNYECFYTGDFEPVIELFEGVYTVDEIRKVYRKWVNKPVSPRDFAQEGK